MPIMEPSFTEPFAAAFTVPSGTMWFAHYGTIPTWLLLTTWLVGAALVGPLLRLLAQPGRGGGERTSLAGRTTERTAFVAPLREGTEMTGVLMVFSRQARHVQQWILPTLAGA